MTSTTFFLIFIPLLAFILLAVNLIFAPHNPYQEKDSAFECGFHSFLGQNRTQFSISFFIFALLFLLFDLEILLVYPYIVSAYVNGIYGLVVMLIFFLVLTLGFAFELGKNALKIDSRQAYSTLPNRPDMLFNLHLQEAQLIRFKDNTDVYLYKLIFVILIICYIFSYLMDVMELFNFIGRVINNPSIMFCSLLFCYLRKTVFSRLTSFIKNSVYYVWCYELVLEYGVYKGISHISIGLFLGVFTILLNNLYMCINLILAFALFSYSLDLFMPFMFFFSLFLILIISSLCLIYINHINVEFKQKYPLLYYVLFALLTLTIALSIYLIFYEISELISTLLGNFINMLQFPGGGDNNPPGPSGPGNPYNSGGPNPPGGPYGPYYSPDPRSIGARYRRRISRNKELKTRDLRKFELSLKEIIELRKVETANVDRDLSQEDLKEYTKTEMHTLKFKKDWEEAKVELRVEAEVGFCVRSRIEKHYRNNYNSILVNNKPTFELKRANEQKGNYPPYPSPSFS